MKINKEYSKKLNILYVEDELEAANQLSKFLGRVFHKIYYCSNGRDALEVFSKEHIDLIISDVNMPILDGLELSEKIRKINSSIPIILTTARTETSCLVKAIELNIDSYLLKPIELDVLSDKIISVCEKIEASESKKILEQYKLAIDESSIVLKFNEKGKITFINSKYEEFTNFKKDEVKNKNFNFNSTSEFKDLKLFEILEDLQNSKIWKGKLFGKTKENKNYILNSTIMPILDNMDKNLEYICICNDITEEEGITKLLKVELEEFREDLTGKSHLLNEYKRCLDISSILINLDKNLKIANINTKFLKLLNTSAEQFIGKSLDEIIQDEELFEDILTLNKNIHKIVKLSFENKEFFIDFTFSAVYNEHKEIIEYLAVGNDISEIIELQIEIENTQKDLILTLGAIGESRSKETANHVNRVALYSYLLAKEYGLSLEEANLLKMASPMHDIGKIGIPDSILNKPGKLTVEEFEVMKSHTNIGFNMFKNSNRKILKSASVVAHEHHEKWDGTGYPRGLKGKNIHIFGRITAVADVFDALHSSRCYKKAWSLEEIKEYMKQNSGISFEPKLVKLLLKNMDKILEIAEEYKD